MTQNKSKLLDAIIIETAPQPTTSIIWLHGLGADGNDFAGIVSELGLPEEPGIRFIFPHAPAIPVTINQGMVMPAWYDIITAFTGSDFKRSEDETGIRHSCRQIEQLIQHEITSGITSDRIFLAGFSQGGAIALHCGIRFPQRLAGIIALSTYLPLASSLNIEKSTANQDLPILMVHGLSDPIVPLPLAEQSRARLQASGYTVDWLDYPIEHSVCTDEIRAIADWLSQQLSHAD